MGQFHVQIRLRNPISSVCDGPNDGRIDGQKDERRVQRTDGPTDRRADGLAEGRTHPFREMREGI